MLSIQEAIMELEKILIMVGGSDSRIVEIALSKRGFQSLSFQLTPWREESKGFLEIKIVTPCGEILVKEAKGGE